MQIIHEVTEFIEHVKIIAVNLFKSRKLRKALSVSEDGLVFRAGKASDVDKVELLYRELFGKSFLGWLKILYKLSARNFMSVIENESGEIIGFDLFMFEPSELKDNYLHALYIGIAQKYQQKGLSSKLRKYSIDCYNEGRVKGISTLAPFNNVRALRLAQKNGFAITKTSAKPLAYYLFRYLSTKE